MSLAGINFRENILSTVKDCVALGYSYLLPTTRAQKAATIVTACMAAAAVAVFLLACASYKYGWFPDLVGKGLFSEQDGGLMEVVGYIMVAATIIFFSNVMLTGKQKHWLPFMAILFLILIDDMYQMHSALGILFEAKYGIRNYTSDFLAFMCLGAVVPALWALGLYLCPKERTARETYFIFSAYLGLLIFFGVFFDAFDVYIVFHYHDVSETFLGIIEEGGEMALMCLMALTALGFRQTVVYDRIKN